MIKFALILLLIVIATLVAEFVLGLIGVGSQLSDEQAQELLQNNDVAAITAANLITSTVSLLLSCFIYSFFSANLTQTALGNSKEGFEHPHTGSFAFVLILLYLITFIPNTIIGLAGSTTGSYVIQFLLAPFVFIAIAAAHGLRYRLCVGGDDEYPFDANNPD